MTGIPEEERKNGGMEKDVDGGEEEGRAAGK